MLRHGSQCPPATPWLLQVAATKAALEVGLARAQQQLAAYEPFRADFNRHLDIASLGPSYKGTCAAAAKALTAAAGACVFVPRVKARAHC
jgi:hypothetical protein